MGWLVARRYTIWSPREFPLLRSFPVIGPPLGNGDIAPSYSASCGGHDTVHVIIHSETLILGDSWQCNNAAASTVSNAPSLVLSYI